MLAEKFILALETLIRSRTYPDGSPRVASTSPHVPAFRAHRAFNLSPSGRQQTCLLECESAAAPNSHTMFMEWRRCGPRAREARAT